jgi:hypothetical protein
MHWRLDAAALDAVMSQSIAIGAGISLFYSAFRYNYHLL